MFKRLWVLIVLGFMHCPVNSMTPLCRAARDGDIKEVINLIGQGADVNVHNNGTWPALHWAITNENISLVRTLLHAPCSNVNLQSLCDDGRQNATPLHIAAAHAHVDILQELLNRPDINVHVRNLAGQTALEIAQKKSNTAARLIQRHIAQPKMLVFASALHPRLGTKSPAQVLPQDILRIIFGFLIEGPYQ